jgi:thioredoxin 2
VDTKAPHGAESALRGPRFDQRGLIVSCSSCGQQNRLVYERLGSEVRCAHCKQPLAPPSEPLAIASTADFDRLVAGSALPVLVDYWAPWCGPCRIVAPELQKVAARRAGRVLVVKVNTDELPDLGERFGIRSIPTLALFAGGREVSRAAGARPAGEIEALLDEHAPLPHGGH